MEETWPVIFSRAADGHNMDLVTKREKEYLYNSAIRITETAFQHITPLLFFLYNPVLHPAAPYELSKNIFDCVAPSTPCPVKIL